MAQETIKKINTIISSSEKLSNEKKEELSTLIKELESELVNLEKTEREQAKSIAEFARLATHESLREEQDQELLKIAADGLKTSIRRFEATHPKLTRIINSICIAFGV